MKTKIISSQKVPSRIRIAIEKQERQMGIISQTKNFDGTITKKKIIDFNDIPSVIRRKLI